MSINIIDKKLSFGNNYSVRQGPPPGIVLHHAACDGSVEDIHKYHRMVNNWAGIGYHFYVRKDGKIYRGRPECWYGAHTEGYNNRIGVCAEGNFENEEMGAAQKKALIGLLQHLLKCYGSVPIQGHREFDATACPGKNYPLAEIVAAATKKPTATKAPKKNTVKAFQTACIADGISVGEAGADNIWGPDTADAATNNFLRFGSEGERVALLQTLLIELGYDLGEAGADGIFGDKTLAAVREFQTANGLADDGIVGINTWKAILGV